MTTISGGSPPRGPTPMGQAAPVGGSAGAKVSFGPAADALAWGLTVELRTRPARIQEAYVGFRNMLGTEPARLQFDRCLAANYPDLWKAVGEGKDRDGWSSSDTFASTAANWCGEALIQQRKQLSPKDVKANYAQVRDALASDKHRQIMDRYIETRARGLARELEIS